MSSFGKPELDYIISPLTGRTFEFNQGGVRLLNVFGLGMPRMSTKEEIVRERGVFQHGSTTVMEKLPETREWGMLMDISGASSRQEYWDLRELLIRTFNPARSTKCGFDVPVPLQYTKVLPNGQKRHLDFFYKSGLFDSQSEPPDGRYENIVVRLTSSDLTLYSDNEERDFDSSTFVDPLGTVVGDIKRWLVDEATLPNQYENKGSWCGCPILEFDINFNGDADYTLAGIIVKNVTTQQQFTFKHVDFATGGGWGAFASTGGNDKILFNVCERVLQRQNSLGVWTTGLELTARETTDWSSFQLTPEDEFVFGIEISDPTNVLVENINFNYVTRYLGI